MHIKNIYLINLKRRQDRLEFFKKNILNRLNISNINVIEAVDGRSITYDEKMLKRINPWNIVNNKPKSYGVIGCCMSHLKIYENLEYSDDHVYLIFEDDVTFSRLINNPLEYLENLNIPDDWGILYLNNRYSHENNNELMKFEESVSLTTESYLIKGSCAKELLEYNINNIGAIDAHMQQYFSNSKFKQYALYNPLFKQNLSLNTDIQKLDYKPIFEKCFGFVINLKRRPDRLKLFWSKYIKNDFVDLRVKNAVDGKNDLTKTKSYSIFKNKNIRLKPGEIGCLLSHYEIWSYMIRIGLPFCIIYEDDVQFCSHYNQRLYTLLKELVNDFHILYLGGRFKPEFRTNYLEKVTNNIYKHPCDSILNNYVRNGSDLDRTTHAYVISLQCARLLCNELETKYDCCTQLDHFMLRFILKNNYIVHNSQPLIAWSPMNSDSDIR